MYKLTCLVGPQFPLSETYIYALMTRGKLRKKNSLDYPEEFDSDLTEPL
jgi:hypothetical protein